ncbi:MAG: hypothetical protein J7483_08835 [Novosphingobium sp.]|nr:hypothetical protein [Novosphingobium sp.]
MAHKPSRWFLLELRHLAPLALLTSSVFVPNVWAAPPTASPEPAVIAQRIWSSLLTHCGGSYFYAGSSLDAGGMLADVQVGKNDLLEFQGVTFHQVPIRVSDAERANGISYRARISMIAHIYREGDDPWQDGPDMQRRNMDDMIGRALADVNGDLFGMGGGGSIVIEIIQFKGRWVMSRSSPDFSGSISRRGGLYYVDEFVKAPAPRYSCAEKKVLPVPPSPEAIAAKKATDDKAAAEAAAEAKAKADAEAAERKRAENEKREADARREKEAADARAAAAREAKLAVWRFEARSVPDFMAALRANLAKRAAQYGFSVADYEPELQQIEAMAKTCVKLTPQDWWDANQQSRNPYADMLKAPKRPRSAEQIRQMLHNCDGSGENRQYFGTRLSPSDKPFGLGIAWQMAEFNPRGTVARVEPTPYVRFSATIWLSDEQLGRLNASGKAEDTPIYVDVIDARIPLLSTKGL